MVNQRVKLKKKITKTYRTKKSGRLGTIIAEAHNGTWWWIRWDGCKGIQKVMKNLVSIESNVADIVNSILVHKIKNQ